MEELGPQSLHGHVTGHPIDNQYQFDELVS